MTREIQLAISFSNEMIIEYEDNRIDYMVQFASELDTDEIGNNLDDWIEVYEDLVDDLEFEPNMAHIDWHLIMNNQFANTFETWLIAGMSDKDPLAASELLIRIDLCRNLANQLN